MDSFESFELTPINVVEQIDLRESSGLIAIRRTQDGKTILVRAADYRAMDKPTPAAIVNIDAALGLVLDIGIKRERQLTFGQGFYAPLDLEPRQSNRLVTQADFDEVAFDTLTKSLNAHYQSGDPALETFAIKANHLIETYNDARLLYPRFHNESYLGMMRILDAISGPRGALEFALVSATVSAALNAEISKKISEVSGLVSRIQLAREVFEKRLRSANAVVASKMSNLDQHGRLVFACFYSAYQYRNKFVHQGFPFPDTVKDVWDLNSSSAYLNPVTGLFHMHRFVPTGLDKDKDLIDIHEVVGNPHEVAEFRERLFMLIPTWHFVKQLARESLLAEIRSPRALGPLSESETP